MEIFFQQLANGLTVGSIYALIALGYTMVYGILKLINFAHGDLAVLGAFIGLTVITSLTGAGAAPSHWVVILAFVVAVLVVAIAGVLLELTAYRPLRHAHRLSAVVSALGASMLLENGIMLIWSPQTLTFPEGILPSTNYVIGGVVLNSTQILIVAISFLLMLALYLYVNKTRFGTAIRASAIDQDAARLMGINVNRVIVSVFILGPALGAIGGLFIGIYYRQAVFDMGWIYGLNAFIAAIIGGIGNIPGAMLGGLLLGLFNSLAGGYISSTWQEAITFALLILILLVRPTGILGERVAEKV
ncbi:branched-chain amino acid ABC transporter permease [Mangrovitalea sediminis]|uniref:branched-chain amino acid ABC transporter permease n=1 Tax=Mangrovitalea sediminis TaxID=1982043 RepID=UPI000BE4D498|nr:branched-chain amino acid ABC transporter permease [Mangrovitalea sediminis]